MGPEQGSSLEWNVAIGEFDLTAYQGMMVTEHFTLQSRRLAPTPGTWPSRLAATLRSRATDSAVRAAVPRKHKRPMKGLKDMERMTSKLTGAFVVLLLFAAAVTTAKSQERPQKVNVIYGIDKDGAMKQYVHRVVGTGPGPAFQGPNNVGVGWSDYKSVFSGGADVIYGIRPDGVLVWQAYRSAGRGDPNMSWVGPKEVGRGWGDFKQVFSGGDGIIYAMTPEGKLLWYKHNGYLDGRGVGSPGAWEGPKEVGSGWNYWKQVFPGGNGIVYAIAPDNRLKWYRHIEYAQGAKAWEGPKDVGGPGWGTYKEVFSSGDGILYAVTDDGRLLWYWERDYLHGVKAWDGPNEVAAGWGDFKQVFALLSGSSSPAPEGRPRTSGTETSIDNFGKTNAALDTAQALNSIRLQVRYKKEYGYKYDSGVFAGSGPSSCGEFSISAGPDPPVRLEYLIGIHKIDKMRESDGFYVCDFMVTDLPLNAPIKVGVDLVDHRSSPFEAWKGGSQAQPPPGQQRTIIIVGGRASGINGVDAGIFAERGRVQDKTRTVTLTEAQPRATLVFEMVYAPPAGAETSIDNFGQRETGGRRSLRGVDAERYPDVNDLAAKGEGIANQDPLAVELRNRQPEGPARRGFDIGMAAAEGQTLPGPGKQRIHDALSPEQQGGFDTAVAFSLERNRNADLAAKGAAIAKADPVVAEARTAEADVFYWLGFDIATGIFGDPALGARGNTATGPGSLKIRDALSAAGQRGFNAAVKLHLSRNYKP